MKTKADTMTQLLFSLYVSEVSAARSIMKEASDEKCNTFCSDISWWLSYKAEGIMRHATTARALEHVIARLWNAPDNEVDVKDLHDYCLNEVLRRVRSGSRSTSILSNLKNELEAAAWGEVLDIVKTGL